MANGLKNRESNADAGKQDVVPSTDRRIKLVDSLFFVAVIVPCLYLFVLVFKNTMGWRIAWDLPLMLYTGFLMEHFSYVPYRDFFDMNMLGSHLTYMSIGKVFGFTDIGIRWADLTYVLAIMGSTSLLTRTMGFRVRMLAPFIFVFWYLSQGPSSTLQREIVALPFVILGAAAGISFPKISRETRAAAAGLLFGLAATIKPHLAIGLPIVLLYLASEDQEAEAGWRPSLRRAVSVALFAGGGFLVPMTFVVSYLHYTGALAGFRETLLEYLPLYASLNYDLDVLAPSERPLYDLRAALKNLYPFLPAGALPLMYGMCNPGYSLRVQKQVALLAGMGIVYWLYPIISGQFWSYHYFPLTYFMCTGLALVVGPWSSKSFFMQRLLPVAVVLLVLLQLFRPHENFDVLFPRGKPSASVRRADGIADFLGKNLQPGDKVQPLDVVGAGAVNGMLLARAEIATPFIYWFHFFHHVDTPYIVQLRQRFLGALRAAPPRFIVQSKMQSTYDLPKQFPELAAFLRENYVSVVNVKDYVILERSNAASVEMGR